MTHLWSATVTVGDETRLRCTFCGKAVSSPITPTPTDTPDKGLIVRAVITCPECMVTAEQRKD